MIRVTTCWTLPPSRLDLQTKLPASTLLPINTNGTPPVPTFLFALPDPIAKPYRHHAPAKLYFTIGEAPARDWGKWIRESHQGYAAGWEDALRSVVAGSSIAGGQECKFTKEYFAFS
jgi:hypothetical protein